ncbi:hypothetical protein AAFN90_03900 [Erwiniaceae bacterium CAU 1747]
MKYWLPVVLSLVAAASAQAEDYRVVSSPSLALDVYIDHVASSAPQSWCVEKLNLHIVSAKATESAVLSQFLPQVGHLLHSQCGKLKALLWQMTRRGGSVLAVGTALQKSGWQPVITADATATATADNAAPLDITRPADTAPLHQFDLPGGCHFRTWWDERASSLIIPETKSMTCTADGWLEGSSKLSLVNGQNAAQPLAVTFYQGYPLRDLHPASGELKIVTANSQRMVVSRPDAPDSWLVLPFVPRLHVWSFEGTLLVKMDKTDATNTAEIRERVETLRRTWSSAINPRVKVSVLLVDVLYADLADPAAGAWRIVN